MSTECRNFDLGVRPAKRLSHPRTCKKLKGFLFVCVRQKHDLKLNISIIKTSKIEATNTYYFIISIQIFFFENILTFIIERVKRKTGTPPNAKVLRKIEKSSGFIAALIIKTTFCG